MKRSDVSLFLGLRSAHEQSQVHLTIRTCVRWAVRPTVCHPRAFRAGCTPLGTIGDVPLGLEILLVHTRGMHKRVPPRIVTEIAEPVRSHPGEA